MSGYLGSFKIDDLLTWTVNTQVFATGVATDADSVPTYRIYEDETTTPILTGSMALIDSANTAGFYSEQITLSAANGFEKGKCYSIYIAATVSSVAGATNRSLQIQAEVAVASINTSAITAASIASDAITAAKIADGAIDANTFAAGAIVAATIADGAIDAATFAANAITSTVIANDAITDAKVASDVTIASVTGAVGSVTGSVGSVVGAVGSVTGNLGGNVVGSVGSVVGAVGSVAGSVASVSGAVGSVTGNVGGNVTGSVGSLATQAKADVNAEVVDALATDTYTEIGQGSPAATASITTMLRYLYKNWRNKKTQTSTTWNLFADDAATVDQKATVSDDGTTSTKNEIATGP